jgi:beta propeller domain-containing protein
MAPTAGLPRVDWWKVVGGVAIAAVIGGIASAAPANLVAEQTDVVTDSPSSGVSLVAFDSCDKALTGLRAAAWPHIGPFGFGSAGPMFSDVVEAPMAADGGQPAPRATQEQKAAAPEQNSAPGTDYSTTNNHEVGVDEPDIVKTDGKRLVSVVNGQLKVIDVASRKVTGTLDLPNMYVSEMLLSGDRALLVTTQGGFVDDMPMPRGKPAPPMNPGMASSLVLVDLASTPKTLGTLGIDGGYVDARQVGSVARVVVRSQPQLNFVYPDQTRTYNSSLDENREIAARSRIDDWLPRYQLDSGGTHTEGRLVDCGNVSHAVTYSGTAMLTVLTVDLTKALDKGEPVTVAADGDTVYGTGSSLYIADDHQSRMVPLRFNTGISGSAPETPATPQRTQIHRFDISGSGPPRYAGSGQVDGTLLNQYSLSEYNGNLRVATTVGQAGPMPDGAGSGQSQSIVTVLARKDNGLPEIGRIGGLGKGERIYAVRFLGTVGYVVTFRQMDPLYTLDLSQPARPRVVGELKITGYSAYLHPVGDGKVLGVGQDATDQGRRIGAQVSLFDVGNPAAPNRMAQHEIQSGSSEVEYDAHAFLYWPERNLVVVPVTDNLRTKAPTQYRPVNYALVLRLDGSSITELGRITHPVGMISRSLVIGDDLWTVSDAGVMVNDLGKLAQQAWIPLR